MVRYRLINTLQPPRRQSLASIAVVALSIVSTPTHAVGFDAEIGYTSDDNVTRAQRDEDILKDEFVSASVGVSFLHWLNTNSRLIYRGFLRGEKYNEYEGLSNTSIGGQVNFQHRTSGQFTAPTYGAFFRAGAQEFDSDRRDSNFYSLGASWRKPLTDRVTTLVQLAYNIRDSDSTVFDTKEISLLGNVDYSLGQGWTLYLTYNYLDGDVVSSANIDEYGALPWVNKLADAAEEINLDDAFDDDTWVAYRLDAKTNVVTIGTNVGFGEHHSFDISARWIDSDAADGISYKRKQIGLAYLLRF